MEKDYDFIAELFLIIGGFILAETVIRWFLSLSEGVLPSWILPALSILFIITALDIKKYGLLNIKAGIVSTLFLGSSIVLIVLMKTNNISPILFLKVILGLVIFSIILQLIIMLTSKRKIK